MIVKNLRNLVLAMLLNPAKKTVVSLSQWEMMQMSSLMVLVIQRMLIQQRLQNKKMLGKLREITSTMRVLLTLMLWNKQRLRLISLRQTRETLITLVS